MNKSNGSLFGRDIWALEVEEASYELHEVEAKQVVVTVWLCLIAIDHVHVVERLVDRDVWACVGNDCIG